MSAGRVGVCRRADTSRSACWVGTCQRADPAPVGGPTPFLSACRHPEASPPRVPREPDNYPQKVAILIDQHQRADGTSRHLQLYRHASAIRTIARDMSGGSEISRCCSRPISRLVSGETSPRIGRRGNWLRPMQRRASGERTPCIGRCKDKRRATTRGALVGTF